jgi:phosphoglucosamine mutase
VSLRFGTDGVRGVAGSELTPELVLALGRAAARVLCPDRPGDGGRPHLVVARDTRRSGPMLEAAFAAGAVARGSTWSTSACCRPRASRTWPPPKASPRDGLGVAQPLRRQRDQAVRSRRRKLETETERALEALLDEVRAGSDPAPHRPAPTSGTSRPARPRGGLRRRPRLVVPPGRPRRDRGGRRLRERAASSTAPAALSRLGAWVEVLADAPNGVNINDGCGSTSPEALQAAVVAAGADVGLALDGDADRVLAVDATGALVDGDQLLALFADDLRARGVLRHDAVAVTVMSNLGLRLALAERGIEVVETPVGDRHVLEAIEDAGLSLGGEQSGHVIFADHAATGDGTYTGMVLLDLLARAGRPLQELVAGRMVRLPQVLRNVRGRGPRRPARGRGRCGRRWPTSRRSSDAAVACCSDRAARSRSCG